jgi:hypothetical protein
MRAAYYPSPDRKPVFYAWREQVFAASPASVAETEAVYLPSDAGRSQGGCEKAQADALVPVPILN